MKAIIITIAVFLVLAIGMMGYVIGISECTNAQIVPTENTNVYIPHQEASMNPLNTITEQSTDERGLISVAFIRDGKHWALDYLSRKEYDSAFIDYLNYKP